jgi:enoyl-CoA hydratase
LIEFERRGPVAIVTLNRPDARNAISRALEQALFDALEKIDSDPSIWVGVLAANGSTFCAGADLKEINTKGAPPSAVQSADAPKRESIVSRAHVKPLIAAVEGPAMGGGAELVLACDLIVASTAAKFSLPEVRWGLLASGGGMFRLPRAMPKRIAMQLALTGDAIDAKRAYEVGFINTLVDPGRALDTALNMAARIAQNGPLAVQNTRRVMEETAFLSEAEAWALSRAAVKANFETADSKEGPRAFAEKRPPQWRAK